MNARHATLPFLICVAAGGLAQEPNDPIRHVEILGHVYEPVRLKATNERVQNLRLPEGFSIQRFAEGLNNPRMIDVSDKRHSLLEAMEGHVIARGDLVGHFAKE